jgi:hypothetical protein
MKQQFDEEQFDLINVGTDWHTANILTKPFTSPKKWEDLDSSRRQDEGEPSSSQVCVSSKCQRSGGQQ